MRAAQRLRGLEMLVQALTLRQHPDCEPALSDPWLGLLGEAIRGIVRCNGVREHLHEVVGLLALRVTDNASRTGEHRNARQLHRPGPGYPEHRLCRGEPRVRAVAFDFAVPAAGQAWTGLGLALIRLTDLTVSFALALWVALRSRGVEYPHWRELLTQVLRRVFSNPRGFLLPQWEPQQTPSA